MDDAHIALVIEALHQVAADPDRWSQLLDALAEAPPLEGVPQAAVEGLAQSQAIARLAAAGEPAAAQAPVGWVMLSERRRVAAANDAAHAIMARGLGALTLGDAPRFLDPANDEALDRALGQARTAAQTILKLEREGEEGPCFAYVVPAHALPEAGPADARGFALVFPAVAETSRLWASLRDSFGLTPAEIRLAARLRDGKTLKDAADELDVSINTVRNQLRAVFDKMGLKRQSDLVRALSELAQVAGAIEPRPASAPTDGPPVLSLRLPDGRALAYRDDGDPAGHPVLFFHEGLGSSLMLPGAGALCRELGLRMIAVERPGFGQSDPHPDYSFDAVADDVVVLADRLGLSEVSLCGVLSGAPSAIQTAVRLGPRARRVLLLSGRPPRPTVRAGDLMTRFRQRFETHPWVVETFFGILRLRLNSPDTQKLVAANTSLSAGDRAFLAANPWAIDFIADYVRECLARTARGVADEFRAFRRSGNLTAADLACPLDVWHGEEDAFAPLSDLLDYLGDRPREVRAFAGIGHMLTLQRWDEVLRHLAAR